MNDLTSLKLSVSLTQLIEQQLGPSDRAGKWPCPFHEERTPSFGVFTDQTGAERYKCFGCGATGDVFDWLESTGQARSLSEAVQLLDGKPGQPIKLSPEAQARIEQICLERLAL